MKICIVSPYMPYYFRRDDPAFREGKAALYGGAEVQAAFLARAFRAAGHEVSFVVANLRPDEKLPFPAENAFHSDDGPPGIRFFHPRLSGAYRALSRIDADVFYQRNASWLTGVTALHCRRRGSVFVYGAGSDTDFSFKRARMDNFRDRVIFYLGLKLAHGIVVQNEYQKDDYVGKHSSPVRVIHNGVDVIDTRPAGKKKLIVWIGGLRRIKQPELFLDLARRIPAEKFVLLGGGSGVEPTFEEQILEEASSIPNLTLTGHLPHTEIRKYLDHAVVLVNTSRVEGFPNAYLEAWSSGVPVVSFNDVDELIAANNLGKICSGIDEMEAVIRLIVTDPEWVEAMREGARALVTERFSAPVLVEKYLSFFEELIYRHPKARHRYEGSVMETRKKAE